MLLTTPEQLALFCAWEGARAYFADLACVIVDEIHAVHASKRGDLLSLDLARLQTFAPNLRRVGLSATVNDPDMIRAWLSPSPGRIPDLVLGEAGAPPVIEVLLSENHVPWAGHTAQHAMAEVYEVIKQARTALVFVNTCWQAEFAFQEPWRLNEDGLATRLASRQPRRRAAPQVEAAMGRGELRAVFAPRPWTWASTGVRSIWSFSWPRPRAPRGWSSASAAPTTVWTSLSRAILVPASRFALAPAPALALALALALARWRRWRWPPPPVGQRTRSSTLTPAKCSCTATSPTSPRPRTPTTCRCCSTRWKC